MDIFDLVRHHASGGITLFDGSDDWDPGHFFTKSDAEKLAEDQWEWQKQWYDTNWGSQQYWNEQNLQYQKDVLGYQQYLNNLQMQREDTAVQRRVADLKAAGLSPTLAAGSAADTGALHAGQAPQGVAPQHEVGENPRIAVAMFKQQMLKDNLALATSVLGNIADISRTKAETELLNSQTNQMNAWTPIDLKLKEQLYEFNQEYNPYRLQDMIAKIENTKGDTFYKERQSFLVDSQKLLNDDQHGLNALIYAGQILDNDFTRAKIDYQNQEYVKNAIAIELLRSQYKEYEYKKDFYHSRDLPIDFNPSYGGLASIGSMDIRNRVVDKWHKTIDFVSRMVGTTPDFVLRTVKRADHFLESIGLKSLLTRITGGSFDFSE